jgi:small subunit ribosomal protein S10
MIMNAKIRIRLKAYDHKLLDQSATDIVDTAAKPAQRSWSHSVADQDQQVLCSCGRPTLTKIPGAVRDAHAQAGARYSGPTQQTVDALMKLDLSPGVDVEIKL